MGLVVLEISKDKYILSGGFSDIGRGKDRSGSFFKSSRSNLVLLQIVIGGFMGVGVGFAGGTCGGS